MRLAYKNVESERQKQEERMKRMDPKKAQQMERLGMGSIGLEQSRYYLFSVICFFINVRNKIKLY